jgi:hypothetical protein
MPLSHTRTTHRTTRRTARIALAALGLLATLGVSTGAGADATTPSSAPAVAHAAPTSVSAYWTVASDGGVFSFGGTPFYGSTGNITLNKPVVAMTATSPHDSGGYREVASDGGIFDYGDAGFYGSTGNLTLNKPIVGMAPTGDGRGYWLVASDGGIFAFGDAGFYGSMGGQPLNKPIVGMAPTMDGGGYWMVASDGGIFAFGDAGFYGSMGNLTLVKPIVAMATTRDGGGYWMVASDGGIFAFGDAGFYGSLGGVPQSRPIVSMAATADGGGYWFTNSNGAVTAFGDASYWGSAPQVLSQPMVGMAEGTGTGSFAGSSYPSGSFGYDISKWQCPSNGGSLPPSPHTVGLVQVEEPGYPNPCLAQEAAWAGGGLNLYIYLNAGSDNLGSDPACQATLSPQSCDYGFNAAVQAFNDAQAANVYTSVAWWLDVEDSSLLGNTGATSALVQGAIDGLRYAGINSVGIYASPGNWQHLVGNYQPAVPYWAADWGLPPTVTCGNVQSIYPGLPTGPVQIVQYSAPSASMSLGGLDSVHYDNDYAC